MISYACHLPAAYACRAELQQYSLETLSLTVAHGHIDTQELTAICDRQGIGDDADVESSSAATVQTEEGYQPVFFDPRPLKNLLLIDEMESLSPIMDLKARLVPHQITCLQQLPHSSCRLFVKGIDAAMRSPAIMSI